MRKIEKTLKVHLLVLLSVLFFVSCSEENDVTYPTNEVSRVFQFQSQSLDASPTNEALSVACYLFNNKVLYKVVPELRLDDQNKAVIDVLSGSDSYFIAGFQLDVNEGQTTLEEFLSKTVGSDAPHENSAPMFVSASKNIGSESQISIPLKRGVARIDLNTSFDNRTKINRIVVDNAPSSALPFVEGTGYSVGENKTYDHIFSSPVSGNLEELLYLYESTQPVDVTLYGTYNNTPIQVKMSIPSVSRNKIYVLRILNAGTTVQGGFEILPWETGETIDGKPDASQKIQISSTESSIPTNVTVNHAEGVVNITDQGAQMTLAFVDKSELTMAFFDGPQSDIQITKTGVESTAAGIITKFDITVAPQEIGRLAYSATMHLKSVLSTHSYDFVKLNIASSRHQIETVRLGGLEWMSYNSRGRDLKNQIYSLESATVEQTYIANWVGSTGDFFQFGRQYAYTPWMAYSPSNNLGNQTANAPWTAETHSPCPEGYRVPTRDELRALFVSGQSIPGTYSYNGEEIVGTLHVVPGAPVTSTNVGGTQRYVKLTSKSTGNYLILPLAGSKGDKSTVADPQYGHRVMLWTNTNSGASGGHAWSCMMDFQAYSSARMADYQLPAEGFTTVRCVKN